MNRIVKNTRFRVLVFTILFIVSAFMLCVVSIHGKSDLPFLSGRLVYHSYTNYDNEDSQLYMYDFKTQKLSCISDSFDGVHHCMNAMFHPTKEQITFMGISDSDQWDIFIYDDSEKTLRNVTHKRRGSHEDPKYSPDGSRIVFKETVGDICRICEYSLMDHKFTILKSSREELSMPYYSSDGECIYYARGDGSHSKIMKLIRHKSTRLYRRKQIESYYPIASEYGNTLYFSRWYSHKNHSDQIYSLNLKKNNATRLKFNKKNCDTSDFCEVSRKYAIVSSTRGNGTYDLYLVPIKGRKAINLNRYCKKINTKNNELGADYMPADHTR